MFGPCINCSVRAVSLSAGRQARTARAVTVAWHSVQARQVSQAKAAESFDWQGPQARQQKTSAGRIAENLPALAARDWLRSSLEAYSCRVAGVSFEGRQVWISKLEAGDSFNFQFHPGQRILCQEDRAEFQTLLGGLARCTTRLHTMHSAPASVQNSPWSFAMSQTIHMTAMLSRY